MLQGLGASYWGMDVSDLCTSNWSQMGGVGTPGLWCQLLERVSCVCVGGKGGGSFTNRLQAGLAVK